MSEHGVHAGLSKRLLRSHPSQCKDRVCWVQGQRFTRSAATQAPVDVDPRCNMTSRSGHRKRHRLECRPLTFPSDWPRAEYFFVTRRGLLFVASARSPRRDVAGGSGKVPASNWASRASAKSCSGADHLPPRLLSPDSTASHASGNCASTRSRNAGDSSAQSTCSLWRLMMRTGPAQPATPGVRRTAVTSVAQQCAQASARSCTVQNGWPTAKRGN